ncbi:MAG: 2-amino-4-hydroxy-6-hydroxymethyldihydropteridine diphosphokinase [Candidatus Omnitrophica bacterium CG1_02_46_14]|nr:MAG: 2-amino-4-hydroxy-6-hydroxymethyldihydropteridine diphosphokinase [Candidatus Omnitrophica bacterium CG1_02_46_14]
MAIVYLGIGSNLGDRTAHIEKALGFLKGHEEIKVLAVSALIETDPEGGLPQGKFLNGAIKIDTDLMPLDLLSQLKIIERRLGRVKSEVLNAPRPMDLDILFYDDVVIMSGKTLRIPHPRVAERIFVLKPLLEIAPDLVHPRLNRTIKELLALLQSQDPCPSDVF